MCSLSIYSDDPSVKEYKKSSISHNQIYTYKIQTIYNLEGNSIKEGEEKTKKEKSGGRRKQQSEQYNLQFTLQ